MQKDPNRRYQSAAEFAADLRRWLNYEPTIARPGRIPRRVALWARRNKGWAAALTLILTAAIVFALIGRQLDRLQAVLATEQANAANARAAALEEQELQRQHEALLQQLQRVQNTPHVSGWSRTAWGLGCQAAKLRPGPDVRDQLAATLTGLDARLVKQFFQAGVSSVVFSSDGSRLAIGGHRKEPSQVWDLRADDLRAARAGGEGPVAFQADGTPVQFTVQEGGRRLLVLWDILGNRPLQELPFPGGADESVACAALSHDGAWFSIATSTVEGQGKVSVGQIGRAGLLRQIARPASALAFSPDGKFLVMGDDSGTITIWPLAGGDSLEVVRNGGPAVRSLCFGRNPRLPRPGPDAATLSWLLAVGDAGGTVTIWDLGTQSVVSTCRGSSYDVHAVAFSPDGMTLASAGRMEARLWDLATGRLLLGLVPPNGYRNLMTAVTFSPDGSQLAVGSVAAFGQRGGVDVWELEDGRGLRSLRGLSGGVSRVAFSPDGRWAAGLSHGWQMAVWEIDGNSRLRHVTDAPRGLYADNAALAFSPDGRQFAVAAGRQVRLSDAVSGVVVNSWDLPPALQDQIAFLPGGGLLSVRVETADGKRYPTANASPAQHPRVCRVRELRAGGVVRTLAERPDFNWYVFLMALAPDGSYFVAEGLSGPEGKQRELKAFAGTTGKLLWSMPRDRAGNMALLRLDPTAKTAAFADPAGRTTSLLEMPGRTLLTSLSSFPDGGLAPAARHWGVRNLRPPYGYSLFQRDGKAPLAVLDLDRQVSSEFPTFDQDGRQILWGTMDGSVRVCNLSEVRRRLTEVGLGW